MAPLVIQCCASLIRIFYISAYYAQVAGLYYAINHTDDGFQVFLVLFSFWFTSSSTICNFVSVSCDYGVATLVSIELCFVHELFIGFVMASDEIDES